MIYLILNSLNCAFGDNRTCTMKAQSEKWSPCRKKTLHSYFMTSSTVEDTLNQGLNSLSLVNLSELTPLSPEVIQRQATVNIGTIGHVAHGKSTVVKAISGVQTVRFKNELERNITIKLGYANAKVK